MPFAAGSLEDVEAWANQEFPAYFSEVAKFPAPNFSTIVFDGEYQDGRIILQSMLISALAVGHTNTGQDVYARISADSEVELVGNHITISDDKHFTYMKPVDSLGDIALHEPFNHTIATRHPAGVDRLETLIRYMCLKKGVKAAVQPKLGFFKAHFRAACRDVVRAMIGAVGGDETDDDDTLSGENEI